MESIPLDSRRPGWRTSYLPTSPGAHGPELEPLRLLKSALPDDYTVFHGVHWMRGYEKWSHFGEIDIVILTCRGAGSSVFSTLERVGGVQLRRFTSEYDQHGNQRFTDGLLTFDSIYRFKGRRPPP